jgi:EpsI family protein
MTMSYYNPPVTAQKKFWTVKSIVIGLLLIAAAAISGWLKPTESLADDYPEVMLEQMVPKKFDGWVLQVNNSVVAVDPSVAATLEKTYSQMLTRTYRNAAGDEIMLTIAYGREQSHDNKAHRQEVCYRAQGFTVENVRPSVANLGERSIPVTRMHAVHGTRSEPVTYWFTMGEKVVYSIAERLTVGILYSFQKKVPDGFLVRISNIADDEQRSFALQESFGRSLIEAVDQHLRRRLTGA